MGLQTHLPVTFGSSLFRRLTITANVSDGAHARFVFYHGVALFLVSDRFVQRWAPSQAHKQEDATMYLERQIQKIRPGQWAALEEIDRRFDAVENERAVLLL